ncbi:MAG: glycosyltransferase, partial [Thermodesulfovibrionia bacterium]|nr:glycosyltransferase [Thermodesulfovibrionia bacterium]
LDLYHDNSDYTYFLKVFHEAIIRNNKIFTPTVNHKESGAKFVLFTHALSSGGAERQWCYLAKELDKRGHSVTLLTTNSLDNENGHFLPLLEGTGVTVRSLQSDKFKCDISKLIKNNPDEISLIINKLPSFLSKDVMSLFLCLKEIDPQYVLCQLDYPNIVGGIGAWMAGVQKILLSTRNVNPSHFPAIYLDWFKPFYSALIQSKRVILAGNSKTGIADYASWLNIDPDRFSLTYNGLEQELLDHISNEQTNQFRLSYGINDNTPVICGAFRFSEEKQPLTFIKVIAAVKSEVPELKVFLCGEGPLEDKIKSKIKKLRLEETIHFMGRRDDVFVVIAASDILLLTSKHEGFPNVILEAQYLNLPVVATKVGGVSEIVQEGKNGYLCPHDSEEMLASRCIELLSDPELRNNFGKAGHKYIKENFSLNLVADIVTDILADKTESQLQNEGVK